MGQNPRSGFPRPIQRCARIWSHPHLIRPTAHFQFGRNAPSSSRISPTSGRNERWADTRLDHSCFLTRSWGEPQNLESERLHHRHEKTRTVGWHIPMVFSSCSGSRASTRNRSCVEDAGQSTANCGPSWPICTMCAICGRILATCGPAVANVDRFGPKCGPVFVSETGSRSSNRWPIVA